VAVFYYLASIATIFADKMAIGAIFDEFASVSTKARAVVLIFFQPMVPALLLAAGGAALWRFDLWWAARSREVTR